MGWGANQFSSLLLVYHYHQHLSTTTADALFGVYALGLIPALLIGGPLSDRHGRRLVVPVVAMSAVATGTLMLGAGVGLAALYPGRFLAGVVSGLAFAPGTAWVKELSVAPWGSAADPQIGARRAAISLSAGFGLGPLVAGLLAQWLPDPTVVPYLAHLVVLAAAIPLVWLAPETVATNTPGAVAPVPGRPAEGTPVRGGPLDPRFLRMAAPMAPWVFAAAAISFTVLPAQVTSRTHGYAVAFAAVVAGVTLGAGVGTQPVARRLDARSEALGTQAGLGAIVVGLLLAAGAIHLRSPLLVLVAAAALGAGYGTCLVSGLLEVQRIASPDRLGGLTAVFYALTYVGFAAPVVLSAASALAGYPVLLVVAAGLCVLTTLAIRVGAVRYGRRNCRGGDERRESDGNDRARQGGGRQGGGRQGDGGQGGGGRRRGGRGHR